MSLLPMKSLSVSLPVLFIEARLQGPPDIVFSQMGISFDADKCNVALLRKGIFVWREEQIDSMEL
uniref:Bm10514 n=1 Tax=Brugia malayi TaxID=6279 RepID=A0A0J9XYH7_BRUMA|nr:Bm10514 [Brugia malayi]